MLECAEIDTLFIQSEQVVSENMLKNRHVNTNAYVGRIPDGGSFPLRSGTRIKAYRLGRVAIPTDGGWRPVVDEQCQTNACDFAPEVVSHGSEEYFYSLVGRDMRTDWICIDSMSLRAYPEAELAHLEQGIQDTTRYIFEEFYRSRFILFCDNKIVVTVGVDEEDAPIDTELCDDTNINYQGFVFEQRENGEMDERYVRVAVPVADIPNIAALSLDLLDEAQTVLEYSDETYMENTSLYDVLLPDARISNQLVLDENELMGGAGSQVQGGWDLLELNQAYGTQRVIRNYSFRRDKGAMRFFPDTVFNATLATFDETDPDTWPRFVRVFPYRKVKASKLGVKDVPNPNYKKAPFGITTMPNKRVMEVMSFPNEVSVGGASKVGGVGWDGTAQWVNPPWECNVKRNKGFWMMCYRLAARPNYTEDGFSFFHRLNPKIRLKAVPCPPSLLGDYTEVAPYCFPNQPEGFNNAGVNMAIDN